ncbi:putative nucleotidyltransferase substrate binding domain-containing protein [Rhodoblastus sp.]|uniref:putative nucleotidyltransferase substrate binding domain-containing protein n=1 Tax=Rhodoblastus sp. TaxID=1962975 RepID=UPI003F959A09
MNPIFDASAAPFDRLSLEEAELLRAALDVAYFRPAETIIAEGAAPEGLYIIVKGCVEERAQGELVGLLGPKDFFDSRALVQGAGVSAFITREETICALAPRSDMLRLINSNPRFGAFFYIDISRKLDAMAQQDESAQIETMMRARVRDLFLLPAAVIDSVQSIASAGRIMRDIDCNALLVKNGERMGIVTGMNLSKAVVLKGMTIDEPVGAIAQYDMVTVAPDDFVSQALLMMTKHNKRRLVVKEGENFVGILEDINLLSFFAGNSQLVVGRIDRAATLQELGAAAAQIAEQIRPLRRQGVKFEVVAEIVSDLNRRLFAKLFDLLCPQELRDKCCLIVMGSEGRGEQTIRTDQDNGLILSEPVDATALQKFRDEFSGALADFGFPPCPGHVMVNNPLWSRTLDEYVADFGVWVMAPDEQSAMNVAIFCDAAAVAGDESLLTRAKKILFEKLSHERVFLGRFAKAIEVFEPPIGLFNRLKLAEGDGDALDLKKGGIFPIVHGVRSLAVEQGLEETNTFARLAKLAELGLLKAEFSRDLARALDYLQTLRLDAQLDAAASGSLLRPGELTSMDRELLRDSFQVVKQLRDLLRHHFNLNMF